MLVNNFSHGLVFHASIVTDAAYELFCPSILFFGGIDDFLRKIIDSAECGDLAPL
jgi:hypothetical protein